MRFGSVCSGIEAASVAWETLGWSAAWFAEIEAFPASSLKEHFPNVPNLGDMTHIAQCVRGGLVEAPDVLVGGTPCQAFSVAGARAGLGDKRGQLTISYADLLNAIDEQRIAAGQPECIAVWENVPGVLSDRTNAFGCLLGILCGENDALVPPGKGWSNAGIVHGPQRAIAWRVMDAQYFGVAQRRRRVFLVASARKGFDPAAVLFESEGVRRDTAPRREPGQDASAGAGIGAFIGGIDGENNGHERDDVTGPLMKGSPTGGGRQRTAAVFIAPEKSHYLNAGGMGRQDWETETFVAVAPTLRAGGNTTGGDRPPGTDVDTCDSLIAVAPTLRGDDRRDASAMRGPDRRADDSGVPIVPIAFDSRQDCVSSMSVFGALGSSSPQAQAIAYGFQPRVGRNGRGDMGDVVSALTAQAGDTGKGDAAPCVAFAENSRGEIRLEGGKPGQGTPTIAAGWQVRRLTPTECERLQGFPDGWTQVSHRGKPAADGPRYKALGNSMAVPCMAWIGRRIASHI